MGWAARPLRREVVTAMSELTAYGLPCCGHTESQHADPVYNGRGNTTRCNCCVPRCKHGSATAHPGPLLWSCPGPDQGVSSRATTTDAKGGLEVATDG